MEDDRPARAGSSETVRRVIPLTLDTPRLRLVLDSTEAVLARIAAMSPADQAEVSPDWLARMRSAVPSPWTHGFSVTDRATGVAVGGCGYKGPPDADGAVEIAYGIAEPYRGRGYAKEVASALVDYALGPGGARRVFALTRPELGPSTSVLTACGFECAGEVVDPEDGPVWRWELRTDPGSMRRSPAETKR